jgi:hypothetical protein
VIRTAIILSSITLFVTWYVHTVNRASKGSGLRWEELPGNLAYAGVAAGGLFVLLVSWALAGVYAWHVRGRRVSAVGVLGPPLLRWTAFCVAAFLLGVVLAEAYCAADEYAFKRQSRRYRTKADNDSAFGDGQRYTRHRWWPASGEQLGPTDSPGATD